MARFEKEILPPGYYRVSDGKGGFRWEHLTRERLAKWAAQHTAMKAAGFNLPAPWSHSRESVPVQMGTDGTLPRSDINAGFWESLSIDPKTGALKGILEVPGDKNDPNTPAGKVSTSVKEVSVYGVPSFTMGDTGQTFTDTLAHIALVTHPIQPGQKNFVAIPSGAPSGTLALAMSSMGDPNDTDPASDGIGLPAKAQVTSTVQSLLPLLASRGIVLPVDTNDSNLVERLSVALMQPASQATPPAAATQPPAPNSSIRTPPPGAQAKTPVTVAMSTGNTTVSDPNATLDTVMSHPQVQAMKSNMDQMSAHINSLEKQKRADRIATLVSHGRITKAYSDAYLKPQLDAFQMSFGATTSHQLDTLLVALEQLPAINMQMSVAPDGASFVVNPLDAPTLRDPEKVAEEWLANIS